MTKNYENSRKSFQTERELPLHKAKPAREKMKTNKIKSSHET